MPQLGEDCADTTTGGATWCDSGRPVLMSQVGSSLRQLSEIVENLTTGGYGSVPDQYSLRRFSDRSDS
jgi:hypothetical protein